MALSTKRRRGIRFRRALKQQEASVTRPTRKRRWRLLAVVVSLAALLWFLPAVVAHTPLLRWIMAKATAELNGTVTVRSASLGWLSPIAAHGIEVCDAEGKPVLQATKVAGGKSLAAILLNTSKLGQFRLENPKLTVLLRAGGSNVEDVLANYLAPDEEPSELDVSLQLVDGSVSITDQVNGKAWQIEKLRLSLSTSATANSALKLETSANISDPQHPGRLAVGLTLHRPEAADRPPQSAGELTIETDDLPLAMFESLLRRFALQTELSGRLDCKISTRFGGKEARGKTVVQADVTGADLALSTPRLGTDRVQLRRLHAVCRAARQEDRFEIESSSVDCDLGNVSVQGRVDLGPRKSGSLLSLVLSQSGEIEGRIDLARLAEMLPGTLRIRQETQITSGHVQLALSSRRNPQGKGTVPFSRGENRDSPQAIPQLPQGMVWQGRIEAGDLKATYRDRQLAWEKPILITLAAHDGPQGPVVENLKCESDFLKLHAAGTPRELAASASFNLKQLADQLGQFVDLGGISLAGDGWAHVNWTRSDGQQFESDAELQLRGFQLAMPQRRPWTEENLLVYISASGQMDLAAETQLHAASLEIKTSTDCIQARLTEPVRELRSGGTWTVDLSAQGQLQSWPARLETWVAVDHWDPAGAYDLGAEATVSADRIAVSRARLTVEQLRLRTPSLSIEEPAVELALAGDWDLRQRRLQLEPVSLSSNSLAIQASRMVLEMPQEDPPKITATAKYRGNLERLQQWLAEPEAGRKGRVAGLLSGTVELSQAAGMTDGQLEADVDGLDVTFPSGQRFHEPTVRLVARGSYEHQAKMLRLEHFNFASDSLATRTSGRIAQTGDQTDVQLAGQVQYDLEKLTKLFRPYLGPNVRITGRGTSPLSYRGPLALAGAQAGAGIRWEQAYAYGFQVGSGELKATLAEGILQVDPLDLAVNGGRLLLAPRLRLAPGPRELTLPPGPMAEQVQITPEMCASALKYIAPVLADVSAAQGSFSIDMEGCRVPLDDPAKGELAGRFTIHSVQVGPGPLVRELAILLGRASPAKLRRESVVPFRMVNGRVYHQGLELIFPDLTIRTYGSVGLDQTLAMMAEMPVPPKWLGNNVLGSALRNQIIRLPLGGTLSSPKIDRREMDRVSRQFLENAARNVIEDEVGRQLERLLGPRP